MHLSAGGFFIAILVSSLASGEAIYSLRKASGQLMLLVTFFIVQDIVRRYRDVTKAFVLIVSAGVLVSIYAVVQYWKPSIFAEMFPYAYGGRARHYLLATIGNPEYLGSYITPLALLVFPTMLLRHSTSRRRPFLYVLSMAPSHKSTVHIALTLSTRQRKSRSTLS